MADETKEEWRSIPGFSLYEASDLGRIRSWRKGGCIARRGEIPKVLKSCAHKYGYRMVSIKSDNTGKFQTVTVHSLVLIAFSGQRPKDMDCLHINGVSSDNRLENLRWGTAKENMQDKVRHGTQGFGEKHQNAKYTAEKVRELRRMVSAGESIASAAATLGIGYSSARGITQGRIWKDA